MNGYIIFRLQNFSKKARAKIPLNMYSIKLFINVFQIHQKSPRLVQLTPKVTSVLKLTQKL